MDTCTVNTYEGIHTLAIHTWICTAPFDANASIGALCGLIGLAIAIIIGTITNFGWYIAT